MRPLHTAYLSAYAPATHAGPKSTDLREPGAGHKLPISSGGGCRMAIRVLQAAAKAFTLANFALPLMERLREAGYEVEAIGALDGFESRLMARGFRVHQWELGHTFNPLALVQARRELARFLDAHAYDIVHTHCSFAGIVGNPIAFPRTRALLYTQHGFYVHDGLGPIQRWAWLGIEKVGLRHAHKVICVSQAERDLAVTLGVGDPSKFVTIPGAGVRTGDFWLPEVERRRRRAAIRLGLGLAEEEAVLLTVARLTWDKGYRDLIEATRRLKGEGLRFTLLAAGSGKDEEAIRRAVKAAGVDDSVLFLGWRDDVADLYASADIFVFASHREGLPIAPIEAMASGLPVVVSNLPGCCEEVEHEVSGLLYPVSDVDQLTAALKRLIGDRSLAARLGGNARQRARAFDLEAVLDQQVELYREVAEAL